MKHIIFYEIVNKLKRNPKALRKVKIFAVVGGIGFLLVGSLAVWAGFSALSYVMSSANQIIQSPLTQGHVENVKAELQGLPKFQAINCWGKAQTLLGVQPWIERPALENLTNLKQACFEQSQSTCRGTDCDQIREINNQIEGRFL